MHPVAIKIGSLTIHWYGIMVLVGVLVGWLTTVQRARRHGFDPDHVTELVPWIVIGGLAGARLIFCDIVLEGVFCRCSIVGNFYD